MPLINNPVVFEANEKELIKQIQENGDFAPSDWSCDELLQLRKRIRDYYRNEQVGICAYCKTAVSLISANNAQIEHIAPKSIHPVFTFEPKNLCVVCADCNTIKRDQEVLNEIPDTIKSNNPKRYPWSSNTFKIVHPHIDEYDEHIKIFGKIYVDLSAKGNFTIGACKLNRYIREFGREPQSVDDKQISDVMNSFLESESSIEKANAINKLREMLL